VKEKGEKEVDMLFMFLSFSATCGELPEVCEVRERMARLSEEAQQLRSNAPQMTPEERELKLAEFQREIEALDGILARLDNLLEGNGLFASLKCTASCSNGSCTCWFCSCGCTDGGNPWCGGGGGGGGGDTQSLGTAENKGTPSEVMAIYDVSGRQVMAGRWSNGRLPNLKPGVYFLKYRDGHVKKVVVR